MRWNRLHQRTCFSDSSKSAKNPLQLGSLRVKARHARATRGRALRMIRVCCSKAPRAGTAAQKLTQTSRVELAAVRFNTNATFRVGPQPCPLRRGTPGFTPAGAGAELPSARCSPQSRTSRMFWGWGPKTPETAWGRAGFTPAWRELSFRQSALNAVRTSRIFWGWGPKTRGWGRAGFTPAGRELSSRGPMLARVADPGYRPGPLVLWAAVFFGLTGAPQGALVMTSGPRPRSTPWSRCCPFKMSLRSLAGKPPPLSPARLRCPPLRLLLQATQIALGG